MALMTDERRKEMEEEMNRFELEISAPGKEDLKLSSSGSEKKVLSPPPPPPAVGVLIPEVLAKVPPPPPPSSSPPPQAIQNILKAPPPPPPPIISNRPSLNVPRFIPHQLHRGPGRPAGRPGFMPMRGPGPMGGPPGPMGGHPGPMGGHPGPYHSGPFMPPMHQGQMPRMMPGPMPMPMGMMPSGFCPPGNFGGDPSFMPGGMMPSFEQPVLEEPLEEQPSAPAPAVYAAPFVKSTAESSAVSSPVIRVPESKTATSESATTPSKFERPSYKQESQHAAVGPTIPPSANDDHVTVSKKKEKKKKAIRMAGGQTWEDNSLMDWGSDDFRIFCGDLGNDVTDEVLIRAFSKYPSFVKAKVIRDKRTNKTKGYGFVSFKDPQDFIKAMREMNGKYVGSRPIKLRKSTWRDRNIDLVKKKQKEKEKLGLL